MLHHSHHFIASAIPTCHCFRNPKNLFALATPTINSIGYPNILFLLSPQLSIALAPHSHLLWQSWQLIALAIQTSYCICNPSLPLLLHFHKAVCFEKNNNHLLHNLQYSISTKSQHSIASTIPKNIRFGNPDTPLLWKSQHSLVPKTLTIRGKSTTNSPLLYWHSKSSLPLANLPINCSTIHKFHYPLPHRPWHLIRFGTPNSNLESSTFLHINYFLTTPSACSIALAIPTPHGFTISIAYRAKKVYIQIPSRLVPNLFFSKIVIFCSLWYWTYQWYNKIAI